MAARGQLGRVDKRVRTLTPSSVSYRGRSWSADELASLGAAWMATMLEARVREVPAVATVMIQHPKAVALFAAMASLPEPLIILPRDPRAWLSSPPLPRGTHLFL